MDLPLRALDDAFYSTIIYFGAAALCVVITFIGYFVMVSYIHKLYRFYTRF